MSQASGYNSVSVYESGGGSDLVNLSSPGGGSFFSGPTASVLTVGVSTITVDTFLATNTAIPIASQISVTGNGTDTAFINDDGSDSEFSHSPRRL